MYFSKAAAAAAAAAAAIVGSASLAVAADIPEYVGLSVNASQFNDPTTLQTLRLSYANSSAYIGQIKYDIYSEPLIVSNPAAAADGVAAGITFQSIHQSPTGFQTLYVEPSSSQPVHFSSPHSAPPAGTVSTGFEFVTNQNGVEELRINGTNLFYACQDTTLADQFTWQIYWLAAENPPYDKFCISTPLQIYPTDAAARQ